MLIVSKAIPSPVTTWVDSDSDTPLAEISRKKRAKKAVVTSSTPTATNTSLKPSPVTTSNTKTSQTIRAPGSSISQPRISTSSQVPTPAAKPKSSSTPQANGETYPKFIDGIAPPYAEETEEQTVVRNVSTSKEAADPRQLGVCQYLKRIAEKAGGELQEEI